MPPEPLTSSSKSTAWKPVLQPRLWTEPSSTVTPSQFSLKHLALWIYQNRFGADFQGWGIMSICKELVHANSQNRLAVFLNQEQTQFAGIVIFTELPST